MKSLEFGCKRPAISSEKFCMGVRDLRYYLVSSVMGVRDLRCNPKSYVAQNKTHD